MAADTPGAPAGLAADVEGDVELPRARVEDAARGDAAHRADGAAQRRVGQRVDGDLGRLARCDVRAILLRRASR